MLVVGILSVDRNSGQLDQPLGCELDKRRRSNHLELDQSLPSALI